MRLVFKPLRIAADEILTSYFGIANSASFEEMEKLLISSQISYICWHPYQALPWWRRTFCPYT
jgi:hypothetical protein